MADVSEPQPSPRRSGKGPASGQPSLAITLYRQGELAFKQGQYPLALERFQQLIDHPDTDPPLRLKGKMGLILTQQKLGQLDQARQGCQRVMASDIPEARRWAASLLAKWPESKGAESKGPESKGPRSPAMPPPSPSPSPSPSPPSPSSSLPSDSTGFVPLEPATAATFPTASDKPHPPSMASSDPIGFVPVAPRSTEPLAMGKSQLPSAGIAPSDNARSTTGPNPTTSSPQPNDRPPMAVVDDPISTGSLFHYQHLNQETRETAPQKVVPAVPNAQATSPGAPDIPVELGSTPSPSPQRPVAKALQRRQPIRPFPTPYGLWGAQVITLLVVLWVAITGLHGVLRSLNALLRQIAWPIRLWGFSWLDRAYTVPVIVLILGLILTSPWWMDGLLAQGYGQRPLTPRQLQGKHPEALKQLRQQCQNQGWSLPELRILPDPVPLCFSYGWRPKHLRIVVSQGLLDDSEDEMLGIFLAYELAHMMNRATALMSGLGGVLLVLHTIYRSLSRWADSQSSRFLQILLGGLAQGLYGLFWSLRWGLLWVARLRSRWADRRVEALIQRPDLQQNSLRWMTAHLSAQFTQRHTLPPLWWGVDVLMPISPQAALSPGSFIPRMGEASTLLNDWANPYRRWIVGGASHFPLGERLHWLNQRATQWQQPTLNLADPVGSLPPPRSIARLLRQKSPILGLFLGGGLALGFWFVGGVVMRLGWQRLSWWYQDESLLYGGILLGLGIGLLVRINTLYPDIPATQPIVHDPSLLLGHPHQLPVEGDPCRLTGTLLGPIGTAQWLGQDLYLATLDGVIKLGVSSPQLGLLALRQQPFLLSQWVGRSVTVSGWRRRSNGTVWIDVDTLGPTTQPQTITISTPLWMTLISLGLCLGGLWILWTGG